MARISPLNVPGTTLTFLEPDKRKRPTVARVGAKDEAGKWEKKRFAVTSWRRDGTPIVPDEAKVWVESKRREFVKGTATAGPVDFPEFIRAVADNLAAAGCSDGRQALARHLADAMERLGIRDMNAANFAARVRDWLTKLQTCWSMPRPSSAGQPPDLPGGQR